MAEAHTTCLSQQNPNRITNLPKTREEVSSTTSASAGSPTRLTTHGKNARWGTLPHKAGKTIKCFLIEYVESTLLITIGLHITYLGFYSYSPFYSQIFYLDCYLRTHLVSLRIYFFQLLKASHSASWMKFNVVTISVCPEAGGSPVWTVGMV